MIIPYLFERDALIVLGAGILLDFLIGDPERFPHPVRLMGRAISALEPIFRRFPVDPLIQGAILVVTLVAGAFFMVHLSIVFVSGLSVSLGMAFSSLVVYQGLALRCLAGEVSGVGKALAEGGLDAGRKQVARIVGRDTKDLDQAGVSGAAIESCAENLVDGVLSPLFFAAIGGPALMMGFKAVSTLDSMIGYRNEKYIRFGRFAARLDDLANYVPARMSVLLIALASLLSGLAGAGKVLSVVKEDGRKHASPNSGLSEAAFAAALGVRLAGPLSYGGVFHARPFMNPAGRIPVPGDMTRAMRLLFLCAFLFYAAVLAVGAAGRGLS